MPATRTQTIQTNIIDITSVLASNKNNNVMNNIITSNNPLAPISQLKRYPISTTKDPIKDIEDIKTIIQYYDNKPQRYKNSPTNIRDRAIFVLGFCCGRRIGDMLELTYNDIFNEDMTFKHEVIIQEQKTGKIAKFPILPDAQKALTDYINLKIQSKEQINMNSYIFTSRTTKITTINGLIKPNNHISSCQVWRSLKQMGKETGLDHKYNIGTHTMRKTAVWNVYIASGKNIDLTRVFANHSKTQTTQEYIMTSKDEVYDAMNKMSLGLLV